MGEKHKHLAEWAQLLVGVHGGCSWEAFVGQGRSWWALVS